MTVQGFLDKISKDESNTLEFQRCNERLKNSAMYSALSFC